MNRHRMLELAALWSIALASLAVASYMIYLDRMGEAFGTLLGILPLCLNRIGNLGQSQVMNAMADALAQSSPVQPVASGKPADPLHVVEEDKP